MCQVLAADNHLVHSAIVAVVVFEAVVVQVVAVAAAAEDSRLLVHHPRLRMCNPDIAAVVACRRKFEAVVEVVALEIEAGRAGMETRCSE